MASIKLQSQDLLELGWKWGGRYTSPHKNPREIEVNRIGNFYVLGEGGGEVRRVESKKCVFFLS